MNLFFLIALAVGAQAASEKVVGYPFGVFRYQLRDATQRYEVRDIVVESQTHTPQPSINGNEQTYQHANLNNVVSQSTLTVRDQRTLEFSVNSQKVISVAVNELVEGTDEVGAEVTFHGAEFLYGIPERATDLALKDGHKYRLWNLDIFRYELENDQGIYGSIPFLMAHSASHTVGFLWLNAGDTSVTPSTADGSRTARWLSESGSIDMFLLPGPTPLHVLRQMTAITGKPFLPPLFSLGYHQCRWNYRSEEDSLSVDEGFDTHDIPYDVLWLDIEHTDQKKYFTWDSHNFPNPERLQESLAAKGRKMVTISDPHIKRSAGYHVFDEATAKGYFVKNSAGTADFEGHCWPGTSSWVDFTNPEVRDWYAGLFSYDRYKGATPILYTWVDMNEPSVFNAHEVTMDKTAMHWNNVKHRDVHNVYGHYQTMAVYDALYRRSQGPPHDTTSRPFLLSRAFFAGTQRYSAVWTGDNMANWAHLAKAAPMLLAMSLSGLTFVGADVGGFFDNPEEELSVRWYQVAAFHPFFRGHSHLETKRREPWLFSEETKNSIRKALQQRYRLLPYLYTIFYKASQEGTSVISPLFFYWPQDADTFTMQDEFMLGEHLLVKTISTPRSENNDLHDVFFPGNEVWFHFTTGQRYEGEKRVQVTQDLQGIPVFQRAGSIVPLRERARRSTTAMRNDPYTLQIAVSPQGTAEGSLYVDDTHSFKYKNGAYKYRQFTLNAGRLTSSECVPPTTYWTPQQSTEVFTTNTWVERIRVFGWPAKPSEVTLEYSTPSDIASFNVDGVQGVVAEDLQTRRQLGFEYESGVLTIRKPTALVGLDWTVLIQ